MKIFVATILVLSSLSCYSAGLISGTLSGGGGLAGSTVFTKDWITSTNAEDGRLKLGIYDTNVSSITVTNFVNVTNTFNITNTFNLTNEFSFTNQLTTNNILGVPDAGSVPIIHSDGSISYTNPIPGIVSIVEGSNYITLAPITNNYGSALLVSGTNLVLTSAATLTAKILLTYVSRDGNVSTVYYRTNEISPGVSFVIRSGNSDDTNKVNWWIMP